MSLAPCHDDLIEALEASQESLYRMHPEDVSPIEIAEYRRLRLADVEKTLAFVEAAKRIIDELSSRTVITSAAWILIWGAFLMGLLIGGILL